MRKAWWTVMALGSERPGKVRVMVAIAFFVGIAFKFMFLNL